MEERLIEVQGLKTHFFTEDGVVPALDGVSFHINKGETIGVVGESGCGKSVTALSIMKLIPPTIGRIVQGDILFSGESLLEKSETQMRKIRGNDISMIFQEPMTSLNPVYTVGDQIAEAVQLHQQFDRKKAMKKAVEMLSLVGIPLPEKRVNEYPHQLSGGMRQRVMIAMALSCSPKLLIADEPTTALDVTIQAQILQLMKDLKKDLSTSIMLITHDLGVVAEMAERVAVMYAGRIVEEGDVRSIFRKPLHPYTEGLLKSIPNIDKQKQRLHVIEGMVPNPKNAPSGCSFHPRCPYAKEICHQEEPRVQIIDTNRTISCWLHDEDNRKEAVR